MSSTNSVSSINMGIPSSPLAPSSSSSPTQTSTNAELMAEVESRFEFSDDVKNILKEQMAEATLIAKMAMKKIHDRIGATKAIIASSAISENVEEDLALRLELVTLIEKMAQSAIALKDLEAYTSKRS